MIYTPRENLTIVSITEPRQTISMEELADIIWEKPSDVVYIDISGELYGIICYGDFKRSDNGVLKIGTNFTSLTSPEYMRARQIFKDRKNINAIPIVNEDGKLIGDYKRWDDLLINIPFSISRYNTACIVNRWVAFVKPSSALEVKTEQMMKWKVYLEAFGIHVNIIDRSQIVECIDSVDNIVFTDEDEFRGTDSVYPYFYQEKLDINKAVTCKQFLILIMHSVIANTVVKGLQEQGVQFLAFGVAQGKSYQDIGRKAFERYRISKGIMIPEYKRDFYDEIYSEQYGEYDIEHLPIWHITMNKGVPQLKDGESVFVTIKDGERVTVGQPDVYDHLLYTIGPCIVMGRHVEDKHTIASWLQERLNREGYSYKVRNGGICYANALTGFVKIMNASLGSGDIVIFDAFPELWVNDIRNINILDVYEKNAVSERWLVHCERHCNHKVNKILADTFYEEISPILAQTVKERIPVEQEDFVKVLYIDRYFAEFDGSKYSSVGAIVMNCNPFTYGHRYLIEQALKKVEFLIVFVVEEDESLFAFEERFAMVCDGIMDLKNVFVVPSGDFILSKTSFPEYFIKTLDEDITANVENDVTMFGEKIAPYLNITHRFVGEEPEDKVTNEYNLAMKRILPAYGIQVVEIPRVQQEGDVISASSVRRCLDEGDMDRLDLLVPESTKRILFRVNE